MRSMTSEKEIREFFGESLLIEYKKSDSLKKYPLDKKEDIFNIYLNLYYKTIYSKSSKELKENAIWIIECEKHHIIIELDEYNNANDNAQINKIKNKIPIVYIKVNPDSYLSKNSGKLHVWFEENKDKDLYFDIKKLTKRLNSLKRVIDTVYK